MQSTPLYFPLDADREIQITLTLREYNGIDADPGVITREPTFSEAMALATRLHEKDFMKLTTRSTLP